MKKILLYSLVSLLLAACDGMNDRIKEYLDRGEINYIGKPDSLKTAGGINRIKISWKINADSRIASGKIYWNNKKDSVSFPIDRKSIDEKGYFSYIMDKMPEGTFIFHLYHLSSDNLSSLLAEVSGNVYGDVYKSTLSPRKIIRIEALSDKANIYWGSAGYSLNTKFTYTNIDGVSKTIDVPPTENITVVKDYKLGGEYFYKTTFSPEKEALDVFELSSQVEKFPNYYVNDGLLDNTFPGYSKLDRSTWKIIEFTSEEPDGEGSNGFARLILDNDPATFWHSQWSGSTAPLPHRLVIDMQSEKNIKCITVAKRQGNTDMKSGYVEVSNNNAEWTLAGKMEFAKAVNPNAKTIVLGATVKARYMRFVITETNSPPFVSISEIYAVGSE